MIVEVIESRKWVYIILLSQRTYTSFVNSDDRKTFTQECPNFKFKILLLKNMAQQIWSFELKTGLALTTANPGFNINTLFWFMYFYMTVSFKTLDKKTSVYRGKISGKTYLTLWASCLKIWDFTWVLANQLLNNRPLEYEKMMKRNFSYLKSTFLSTILKLPM